MTRKGITFGGVCLSDFLSDQTGFRDYVKWYRDRLRTKLDPGSTGNDYLVSDIFRWQGLNSNYEGLAFLVDFRNGVGVSKNEQVIFVFHGFTSPNFIQFAVCNNNPTTLFEYLTVADSNTSPVNYQNTMVHGLIPFGGRRRSGLTVTTADSFSIDEEVRNTADTKRGIIRAVAGAGPYTWEVEHTKGPKWAAADAITDVATGLKVATVSSEDWRDFLDIGFTDWTNMSFSGDFSTAATSPYSDMAGFREKYASGALTETMRWKAHRQLQPSNTCLQHYVFDNTKPFMQVYTSFGRSLWLEGSLTMGRILLPKDGSTDYVAGYLGMQMNATNNTGHTAANMIAEGRYYGGGAGTAGYVAMNFTVGYLTSFVELNSVIDASPPTSPEGHVHLYDTNEDFGTFDPDIIRVQGAYRNQYGMITSRGGAGNNLAIHLHEGFATPWSTDLNYMLADFRPGYDVPPKDLWRNS